MQSTLSGGPFNQNMTNIEGVSSPNWNTYNVSPRTLDATRAIESASGGKHTDRIPVDAPARMKPPANGQFR